MMGSSSCVQGPVQTGVVFESERIQFVPLSEALVPDYLAMVNDIENVQRFIRFVYEAHEPYTEEQEIEWVRRKLEAKALNYSMIEKKSGSFIGNIELMDPSDCVAELGIAITAAKQNSGFGTEAIKAILGYAYEVLGFRKIVLKANPDNSRAIHVYEKCGFREYDRNAEHVFMETGREIIR